MHREEKRNEKRAEKMEKRERGKELLEGKEQKDQEEERLKDTEEQQDTTDIITEQEVMRQIKKLKKRKAAGEDGLENEVWIHGGRKVLTRITTLINKVWKGEGMPRRWKVGIISPIFKKGDRDDVKNYRGITLLNTAYKIYAMILENRLSAELEEKKIIPETQAGFRKERSTTDNIFILNYVVNREIKEKRGKLYAFFADLTAAFDKVNGKTEQGYGGKRNK
ncbi:uncharacterized protein LOC123987674 [Osmia bicornis bicornis]|uniref:uncharacterized protein LOC123987674 n=1 Tax=Osmia bicornis bicornis TaxID=1437191 RepID=UPI001EAF1553|nr:uncharacterized protein LOC123987674 [Osmia bicornis bicornis]